MSGAVFLSYASQDSEAAKRICDALRYAGIEAWFDQSELRGGDAWDAKIKRQIRDCALFLPVISEGTQLRREGYFRLEWHLADERSRLIARGTPFLIPVAIDATRERDALVPESFLAVQWTRLPEGAPTQDFVDRVRVLLRGTGEALAPEKTASAAAVAPIARRSTRWIAAGIAAAILIAGAALWRFIDRSHSSPPSPVPPETASAATKTQPEAFPVDPDLKRALKLITSDEAIPEDFYLAEDIMKTVLSRSATDADAVVVMALVQDAFLYRGFDRSHERYATAQHFAERGAQLAPANAYAQGALGIYLYSQQQVDMHRAEQVLNLAISLKPDEPRFYQFRDDALFVDSSVSSREAITSAEKSSARFPRDALLHYELSRHYRDVGRIADMERELDATIALKPITNAIVWKARVALWVRGNPEEMMAILSQVPGRGRSLERVALGHWLYSMVTGKAQDGLDALESLPETWVEDYNFVGPKAVLEAALLDMQGSHEVARLRWSAALAEVKRRQADRPGELALRETEIWCLHGMGRNEEARALLPAYNEGLNRPYRIDFISSWWFTPIPCNLLLGERATAIQLIREAVSQDSTGDGSVVLRDGDSANRIGFKNDFRQILSRDMNLDPRMAPWREDPEIKVLLAKPQAQSH